MIINNLAVQKENNKKIWKKETNKNQYCIQKKFIYIKAASGHELNLRASVSPVSCLPGLQLLIYVPYDVMSVLQVHKLIQLATQPYLSIAAEHFVLIQHDNLCLVD